MPVSVIFGARDRYLGPELAAEMAHLFPVSSLQLVEQAGHYPQIDQPEVVSAAILGAGRRLGIGTCNGEPDDHRSGGS